MEDRQKHSEAGTSYRHEAMPPGYLLSQRLQMVGWREHATLLAEGHYRCPHCRRTDTTEVYSVSIFRY